MDKQRLENLSKFKTASWAVWSEDFDKNGCIEENPEEFYNYILKNRHYLKNNVIFLGLNRSGRQSSAEDSICKPFHNFHAIEHRGDRRLKNIIQDGNLKNLMGAYMTDLSGIVESKSSKVCINQNSLENLKNQLDILDGKEYKIICFGNDVFNNLKSLIGNSNSIKEIDYKIKKSSGIFSGQSLNLYRVWHPGGNWGKYQHYADIELPKQLKYLNVK